MPQQRPLMACNDSWSVYVKIAAWPCVPTSCEVRTAKATATASVADPCTASAIAAWRGNVARYLIPCLIPKPSHKTAAQAAGARPTMSLAGAAQQCHLLAQQPICVRSRPAPNAPKLAPSLGDTQCRCTFCICRNWCGWWPKSHASAGLPPLLPAATRLQLADRVLRRSYCQQHAGPTETAAARPLVLKRLVTC